MSTTNSNWTEYDYEEEYNNIYEAPDSVIDNLSDEDEDGNASPTQITHGILSIITSFHFSDLSCFNICLQII